MSIQIRPARMPAAADIICGLDAVCFPEDALPEIDETTRWWVAWDEQTQQPCGYVRLDAAESTIERVGVLEEYRGNGIARVLVQVAIAFAMVARKPKVTTYAAADNLPSCNLLIGCGFKYAGMWKEGDTTFLNWEMAL